MWLVSRAKQHNLSVKMKISFVFVTTRKFIVLYEITDWSLTFVEIIFSYKIISFDTTHTFYSKLVANSWLNIFKILFSNFKSPDLLLIFENSTLFKDGVKSSA